MVNPLIWPTKIRMITQIWEIKSLTITKQQGFWTLLRLSVRLLRSVGALHGVVEFPQRLNLKKPGCGEAIPDGQLVGWSWLIAANSGVRCLTWIRRLNGFGPTNHSLSVDFFMVNGGNMMEWCYITWCMMATGVGNCWLIVVWCVLFQWYSIIYWGGRWIFWHIHIYIYTHTTLTVHMSFPKPRMYIRSCPLHFRSAPKGGVPKHGSTQWKSIHKQSKIWWYDDMTKSGKIHKEEV